MQYQEQASLYNHVTPIKRFAFFLSHCWASPGYQKYIAVLLYFMAPWALLAGFTGAVAVHLWQTLRAPLPCAMMVDKGMGLSLCLAPWEFLAGMAGIWATFLIGPYLVWGKPGFLDATCIPQAPLEAKLEGIRHLPAFLAECDELIIAWDPLYFSRTWCVYELAMFRGIFPNGRLTVLPIKFYTAMLVIHFGNAASCVAYLAIWPLLGDTSIPTMLCMSAYFAVAAKLGEELEMEQRTLDRELASFDFNAAEVQVESDKRQIVASIEAIWNGRHR